MRLLAATLAALAWVSVATTPSCYPLQVGVTVNGTEAITYGVVRSQLATRPGCAHCNPVCGR